MAATVVTGGCVISCKDDAKDQDDFSKDNNSSLKVFKLGPFTEEVKDFKAKHFL